MIDENDWGSFESAVERSISMIRFSTIDIRMKVEIAASDQYPAPVMIRMVFRPALRHEPREQLEVCFCTLHSDGLHRLEMEYGTPRFTAMVGLQFMGLIDRLADNEEFRLLMMGMSGGAER